MRRPLSDAGPSHPLCTTRVILARRKASFPVVPCRAASLELTDESRESVDVSAHSLRLSRRRSRVRREWAIAPAAIPSEYEVRPLPTHHWMEARAVAELDGSLTDRAGTICSPMCFRAVSSFSEIVARTNRWARRALSTTLLAAGAISPRGARRGTSSSTRPIADRVLGYALVAAVVERFCAAGYEHLWLGVQGWRLPAIRSYLRAGYRPFLHAPNPDALATRWMSIFATLGLPGDIATWPRSLRSGGGDT
jgi:hypothetical protein